MQPGRCQAKHGVCPIQVTTETRHYHGTYQARNMHSSTVHDCVCILRYQPVLLLCFISNFTDGCMCAAACVALRSVLSSAVQLLHTQQQCTLCSAVCAVRQCDNQMVDVLCL
jgi:hypothetical protein